MATTLTRSEVTTLPAPAKQVTEPLSNGSAATENESVTDSAAMPHVRNRKWLWVGVGAVAAVTAVVYGVPWIREMMTTVSTDDAYVNGHMTYVAPRVSGQVANVFVEDNNIVRKGDLLMELDTEPYQVQVNIAQAAVEAAKADLITAQAQVCGIEGQIRSLQFTMKHAIEDVDNKVAELRATVAALDTAKAKLARADADYQRAKSFLRRRFDPYKFAGTA
jgi:membrane fusion protein (multidrug efflux system)